MGLSWAVLPEASHISALAEQCLEQSEYSKTFFNNKHNKQKLQLSETGAARNTPGRKQLTLYHGWASLAQKSLHIIPQRHTPVDLPQPHHLTPFSHSAQFCLCCVQPWHSCHRKKTLSGLERARLSRGIWESREEKALENISKSFRLYPAFTCLHPSL